MNNIKSITLESDIVEIGHNPEMADIVNTAGTIYGERFFVCAVTEKGQVFEHTYSYQDDEEKALAFADKVRDAIAGGRELDPRYWEFRRHVYGSDSYIANEDEILEAERQLG